MCPPREVGIICDAVPDARPEVGSAPEVGARLDAGFTNGKDAIGAAGTA